MILHSQIFGDGPPFIFLHGFLGMGDNWKSMGKQIAELGYEVHLVDQRNHGRSFHSSGMNYDLMATDLEKYCEHYSLDSIILLGHSMGGKTAMNYALKYPEKVQKLIIVDIGPQSYPEHYSDILKALSLLDFNTLKSRREAEEFLSEYIADKGTLLFVSKNLYWKEKEKLGLRLNVTTLTDKLEEVGKAIPENLKFEGQTLFLKGENSKYIRPQDEVLIRKLFPKAEIKTVAKSGHWIHAENPTDFLQIVKKFL